MLAACVAGCSIQPPPSTQPPNLRALLLQITQDDLATTIRIAQVGIQPGGDVPQIQCATFLQGFLPSIAGPGGPNSFIQPTGVASAFETARIAAIDAFQGSAGLSAGQQTALDIACAPLAVSTARLVAAGALQIASLRPNSFVQMLLALAQAHAAGPLPMPLAESRPAAAPDPPPAAPSRPGGQRQPPPAPAALPRRAAPASHVPAVAVADHGGPTIWANTLKP